MLHCASNMYTYYYSIMLNHVSKSHATRRERETTGRVPVFDMYFHYIRTTGASSDFWSRIGGYPVES